MESGGRLPGKETGRRLEAFSGVIAVPLVLVTPFVIFVHYNDYAFSKPEIILCLAAFFGVGLVLSGLVLGVAHLTQRGGWLVASLVSATLLTFFADVQSDWFSAWNWRIGAFFTAATLVSWLLRRHLAAIGTVAFLTILVSTLVMPSGGGWKERQWPGAASGSAASPPLLLHLILDEHIGVEGLPSNFPDGPRVRSMLKKFYSEHGFRLFGRAYSRFYNTQLSIGNLVNLTHSPLPGKFFNGFNEQPGAPLLDNAYFKEMTRRGYAIHVYESHPVTEFCDNEEEVNFARCLSYPAEEIKAIETVPLAVTEKVQLIMGMFVRRSFLLGELRKRYGAVRLTFAERGVELPDWNIAMGRVWAVSVPPVIERLAQDLRRAEPGSLFFAHLGLPHSPYAYDRECDVRGSASSWLLAHHGGMFDRRNTPSSRARRYPLYLEQVICTYEFLGALFDAMQEAGVYDEALIIVHGDHGSRLDLGPPKANFDRFLRKPDYIDAFSTLFAVKFPTTPPGYDERLLAIDSLFRELILTGRIPPGTAWAGAPKVYLVNGPNPMVERTMPDFENGLAR